MDAGKMILNFHKTVSAEIKGKAGYLESLYRPKDRHYRRALPDQIKVRLVS